MNEEISLDKYLVAVWRAKWFIIIMVLAAAGIAAYLGLRQPALHTAVALIEVGRVWKNSLEDPYATAEIANSPGFYQELAEKIGVKPGQLKRSVQAEAVTAGPRRSRYPILVRITATAESGEQAVRFAEEVAGELLRRHDELFDEALRPNLERQQRIEERLKEFSSPSSSESRDLRLKLESELDEIKVQNTSPTLTEKSHLASPVVQASTIRPSVWRGVATTAIVAALATVAAAILFSILRPVGQPETEPVETEQPEAASQ